MVELIEALGFGSVHGFSIRDGHPCFHPAPRVVQSIKLGAVPEQVHERSDNQTLKRAFVDLFARLCRLGDCTVDIEVQHGLPFKLVLERSCEEFA